MFLYRVWRHFIDDRCQRNAAALAYTTLLALVPLAAVVFSALSMFPVFEEWALTLEEFVYKNLVPAAGDVIKEHLQRFTEHTGKLTAIGAVFLVVGAVLLLFTIEETFNEIWHVQEGRRMSQRVLSYWAVLTLGPLLIGASLSLTPYLISLTLSSNQAVLAQAQSYALAALPFVFEVLAFLILYMVVPNCIVRFRDALVGGVVAAILFEIVKRGFAWFVLNFASYQVIYGALATIPIFLIWIYISWLVVLVGAAVVVVLGQRPSRESDTR
jgi:membrane protein